MLLLLVAELGQQRKQYAPRTNREELPFRNLPVSLVVNFSKEPFDEGLVVLDGRVQLRCLVLFPPAQPACSEQIEEGGRV